MNSVNVVTLGCSKNLVDSEHLLAQFRASGYKVLHDDYRTPADLVIINTCGFILDAKQESIDTILSFIEEKRRGNLSKLFVMGCLSERYREDLKAELPEVDGFFGVWEMPRILESAGSVLDRKLMQEREVTTPAHYAYLKISEGCNRTCSFCAIPGIRGGQRSVPVKDLLEETALLADKGVRELILIAQDLTGYGTDLYGHKALPELLMELVKIPRLEWIRLHYAYPAGFPEGVIDLMASEEKICNYLDIPIQHISDGVLRAMGRGLGKKRTIDLLERLRARIPGVAIRTTVVTGFPGESEAAFLELYDFVGSFRFDRLGVFPYSHEEDTPAGNSMRDNIPDHVKSARAESLMKLQQAISMDLNREKIGKCYKVLVDRYENGYYVGRTQHDSPDVDNEVLIHPGRKDQVRAGAFCNVRITGAEEFDLKGEVVP